MIHLQSSSETRRGWQRRRSSKQSESRSDCFELCIWTRYALRFTRWNGYLMYRIDHWPLVDIQSSTKSQYRMIQELFITKSVDTEFDCRGPVDEDDVKHKQRHDILYMSVFATITISFTGECGKRWSRKNAVRFHEEVCKYLLLFLEEMTASRWLVQARVSARPNSKVLLEERNFEDMDEILSFFSTGESILFHEVSNTICAKRRKRSNWWKIDVVNDDGRCVLRNKWDTAECFYILLTWRRESSNGSWRSQRRPGFLWR